MDKLHKLAQAKSKTDSGKNPVRPRETRLFMTDDPSFFLGEAKALGRAIAERAVTVKDGSVSWWNTGVQPPAGLGPHFYDGTTGVAFFLGALAKTQGPDEGRETAELARRALAPIRHQLRRLAADPERAKTVQVKLGAVVGLGAYVYTFLHLAEWLGEPELLAEAHAVAGLITPERIAADRSLDIATGCAGALLALLRLDRAGSEAQPPDGLRPAERALLCGEHLLRQRVTHRDEPMAWSTDGLRPFCGYLHGAAGFAAALKRLAEVSADPELVAAAKKALAFERFHFDAAAGNWPDLRTPGNPFMVAWCHGAAGVAVGRLAMLPEMAGEELNGELAAALATTRDCREQAADHLCCGNLGRAEILLEASRILGDEAFERNARELARRTADRAAGRFRYSHDRHDTTFSPTFFRGAAGIGYSFLRFADPESLPCVLTFQ
jgi:type 2 lantibiotic biosynthesis protein LanM